MQLKKFEDVRCPWCGHTFIETIEVPDYKYEPKIALCTNCKKWSGTSLWKGEPLVIICICICLFSIRMWGKEWWAMAYTMGSFFPSWLYFMYIHKIAPLFRYLQRETSPNQQVTETFLGRARVRWYSAHKGGIGLPYLRIINNMIFPVCFLDSDGVPVSHTVCVRLQKRFLLFWRATGVRLINDDSWKQDAQGKTPWEKAERFLIFNRGEMIGEGMCIPHLRSDRL